MLQLSFSSAFALLGLIASCHGTIFFTLHRDRLVNQRQDLTLHHETPASTSTHLSR